MAWAQSGAPPPCCVAQRSAMPSLKVERRKPAGPQNLEVEKKPRPAAALRLCSTSIEAVALWDAESWAKLHVLSGPGGLAVY